MTYAWRNAYPVDPQEVPAGLRNLLSLVEQTMDDALLPFNDRYFGKNADGEAVVYGSWRAVRKGPATLTGLLADPQSFSHVILVIWMDERAQAGHIEVALPPHVQLDQAVAQEFFSDDLPGDLVELADFIVSEAERQLRGWRGA